MKRLAAGLVAAGLAVSVIFISVMQSLTMLIAATGAVSDPCVRVVPGGPMSGPVRLPVTGGYSVTSEYGMRYNPGTIGTGDLWFHDGLDLAMANANGPVVAPIAGVVTKVATGAMEGNWIQMDHGSGIETRILHLSRQDVQVGEKVWAGKQIGLQGSTGNSSGSHVHFTILQGGKHTEPRAWLKAHNVDPGNGGTAPGPQPDPGTNPDAKAIPPAQPIPAAGSVTASLPAKVGVWQGEQITNAAHVIRVGQRRNLPQRAIVIAVMTAMGESGLRNLPHGDAVRADTIGLFQEGPERGPYERRMNPEGAAEIFYDHLVKVPNYLTIEPTLAAHQTQRNADPWHYQRWWSDALTMVATLTANPDILKGLPGSDLEGCETPGKPGAGAPDGTIVSVARHWIGTPYSWGGGTKHGPSLGIYTSPALDGSRTVGFDCSGLVLHAVAKATGIELAHSAEQQGLDPRGSAVARDMLQPGDVISFSPDGGTTWSHVGIFIGASKMIHAPQPGDVVKEESLNQSYWQQQQWRIRRYAKQ